MIVFIVGCDRTGTHWLAKTLLQHPDIEGSIEQLPQFSWSLGIAFRPELAAEYLPKMIRVYRENDVAVGDRLYLDKAHMNLWIFNELIEAFPNAKFIATRRNVYSTVASIHNHGGVSWDCLVNCSVASWPNYYLGAKTLDTYMNEPPWTRFARKWKSHDTYIRQLEAQVHVWDYDKCSADPNEEFGRVCDYIGIDRLEEQFEPYDNLRAAAETLSLEDIETIKIAVERLEVEE